jgi:NAD(P)-dependent dehydrogenase (short-subunit alcohol dehydrogenase family)
MKDFVASIPVGRGGLPIDIAEAVCFLLDEQRAGFIVGSVLFVDGGHDAMFRPNQF